MKKWILCLILAIFVVGCQSTELAEQFDQNTIDETNEQIITWINEENVEELQANSSAKMNDVLTEEAWNQVFALTKEAGEFDGIIESTTIGKNDTTNGDYAVSVVKAKYTNQDIIYTISLDQAYNLIGLYLK